jgi:pentatricopeptide repeat protein
MLDRVDEAFSLLRLFEKDGYVLDVRGYSCLIRGLFRAKRYEDVQLLYRKMIEDNVKPDVYLYTIMMKGLAEAGKVRDALELLNEMTESGVVPDTVCYNVLIKGFCDMGLLSEARSLQLEISRHDCFPNVKTYSILISGMCRNGLTRDAQEIFNEMEKLGCYPSAVTFNSLIDGLCKTGQLEKAHLLFYKMEIGRNPSLFLRLSQGPSHVLDSASLQKMVEQLCDSGLIHKAYRILMQLADSGDAPGIYTYNILVNGFCKLGNFNGAYKLFREMQFKGLSPDTVTYGTLINGLLRFQREEDAYKVFDQMEKNGCTPDAAVYRTMMTWMCRRMELPRAFSLWLKYLRNIRSQEDEAIKAIEGYFEKQEVEKAVRGLLEMDFKLNDFDLGPYAIWLIGLCQTRRVGEALKIFLILEEYKVVITPPCCVKLIYFLLKEGDLDRAIDVFLYTIEKGYLLRRRVANRILTKLVRRKGEMGKDRAIYLLCRMKSVGYDLDAHLLPWTKSLLHRHNIQEMVNGVPEMNSGCVEMQNSYGRVGQPWKPTVKQRRKMFQLARRKYAGMKNS